MVSECSSLSAGTPASVVVGFCCEVVMLCCSFRRRSSAARSRPHDDRSLNAGSRQTGTAKPHTPLYELTSRTSHDCRVGEDGDAEPGLRTVTCHGAAEPRSRGPF